MRKKKSYFNANPRAFWKREKNQEILIERVNTSYLNVFHIFLFPTMYILEMRVEVVDARAQGGTIDYAYLLQWLHTSLKLPIVRSCHGVHDICPLSP